MRIEDLSAYSIAQFAVKYNRILSNTISGYQPTQNPYAIILGGQPGSGKTTIHKLAIQKDRNVISINADEYRGEHPNISAIYEVYGKKSAEHTQAFANAIAERLIEELSDKTYNLIIEGTLRRSEVPLNTCRILKSKGYTVELSVMAVNKALSWQSTIDRYVKMKELGILPRAVSKETHDYIAEILPDNLDAIFSERVFDRITLYNREGDCLYNSELTKNVSPKNTIKAAIEGRLSHG